MLTSANCIEHKATGIKNFHQSLLCSPCLLVEIKNAATGRVYLATVAEINTNLICINQRWSHGMVWSGMENGMERKFRYGIWKMPEWNGRFQEWNGKQSSILPYQFHTKFCALYLQKNVYQCRVVINIVTEVFNFNICVYYLSTNRGTLVMYIVQTVYVLHHCKYIAI